MIRQASRSPLTVVALLSAFVLIALSSAQTLGQQPAARPDRGAMPGASYSVSDIESISMVNGNLHLSIPLASLPPIAGGKLKLGISAVYNSKLWNSTRTEHQLPPIGNCANWVVNSPQLSELGGWTITAGYRIEVRNAHEDFNYVVPDAPPAQTCETDTAEQQRVQYNYYKTILISPDGAEHELRPVDTNNYYGYNGGTRSYLFNYYKDTPNTTNASMRYYSFDGSFMYAVINPSSSSTLWTVYLNDGTKVTQTSDGIQRITDTNGNSIKIEGATIEDELTGRKIEYGYDAEGNNGDGQGTVSYQTVDGTWEHIYLNFGITTVQGKVYQVDDWNPTGGETGQGAPCAHDVLLTVGPDGVDISVIREIVFPVTEPNQPGRKFSFEYNSDTTESGTDTVSWGCGMSPESYTRTVSHGMGELSEMTAPAGAVVAYEYSRDGTDRFLDADSLARTSITEKHLTHDSVTDPWTYAIDEMDGGGLVTAPDGSTSSETCYALNAGTAMFSGDGKAGLVYRSNRSNKEMVERHWTLMAFDGANTGPAGSNSGFVTFNPVVDAEYSSLLDGNGDPLKMSAKTYSYDYNGNLLTTTDYDWFDPASVSRDAQGVPTGVPSGATVLRTTSNDYYNGASSSSSSNVYAKRSLSTFTPLILSALQQSTTGAAIARLSYDGYSYGTAPSVANLTSKSVWDDVASDWITTSMDYDTYGNVTTSVDGRGKTTTIAYDSSTHAQPTSVTVDPQNSTGTQTTSTVYDYYTGLVKTVTDPNGQVSTIDYTNQLLNAIDPFGRPGITKSPAVTVNGSSQQQQHRVTTTYEDHLLRVTVATDLYAEDDKLLKTRTTADMLGRPVLSEQTEDGTNYSIYALKAYDTVNRISYSSGPMKGTPGSPTSSSTDSWTRVTNDILGRTIEIATFAGASQPPATGTTSVTGFTGTVTTAYDAEFTTVTDQAGKLRRSKVDALGRLLRVDEPNDSGSLGTTSSPNQATSYAYDVFGNLLTVTQGSQTRTFTYDSLSRLRSAVNPESGTISYTYDDNGNLTQKIDPRLLADNVTHVTTSYVYDALNRATSRSYNDGTPTVTYAYDTLTQNGKGRLASVSSSVSSYSYSGYDATGKPLGGSQTLSSQTYSISYVYDLSGHVTSITYPSQRVVNYNYDNAGRLADKDSTHLAFTGNLGDGSTTLRTYAKGITYSPTGQMTQEQFGTSTAVYNKLFYNSRGQLAEVLASTSGSDTTFNRGKIVNDYGTTENNGNLLKQTVYVPNNDSNASPGPTLWYQQYDYDSLNRLSKVREFNSSDTQLWKQTYIYDRYGNRTIDYDNTTNGIPRPQFSVSTSNNRLGVPSGQSGTMSYDSAGNLTTDTYSASAVTRTYDAENRMTQETQASSYVAGTYSYDGDGRRMKRNIGSVETWQVYGLGGELLAEYAANGDDSTPQKEYGYRNGQLLVTVTCAASGESLTYTNNPLEASTSIINAVDITELRDDVNQARAHAGLSAATWTDTSLSGVQIKAVHVTELRTKLDEARSALGLSTVTWTDSSLSGVSVKAVHLSELRTKVAETVTTVDIRWMVVDQLGTPRMAFDQSGALGTVSRHDYLPFGEELSSVDGLRSSSLGYTNADAARQKFTQKERDNETGLDYFLARYYSSTQGRFTSPDEFKGGPRELWVLGSGHPEKQALVYADVSNPQSLNKYQYTFNNPLRYTDPDGQSPQDSIDAQIDRNIRDLASGRITEDQYWERMRGISVGGTVGVLVVVAGRVVLAAPGAVTSILMWAARNPNTVNQLGQEALQMSTGSPAPASGTKLNPQAIEQFGSTIARDVAGMSRGQMATIGAKVSDCGLNQADAVGVIQTAIQKVGKASVAVPQANGTVVVASVQAGTNKPILVVNQQGIVSQARATIIAGMRKGKAFFEVTNITTK
jgi:RHS repeat-associated protein